jgi:hypothetical protein
MGPVSTGSIGAEIFRIIFEFMEEGTNPVSHVERWLRESSLAKEALSTVLFVRSFRDKIQYNGMGAGYGR